MINFTKRVHEDRVVDEKGSIIQEGTLINAELLNRYESIIEELVNKVNQLEETKQE